jgi:hypothetical protein
MNASIGGFTRDIREPDSDEDHHERPQHEDRPQRWLDYATSDERNR